MKNGLIRVMAVFMTVFIIAGVFYGCDANEDKSDNTVTDPQGMTYLAIDGSDGKTYAGVTDANGKLYAAAIDENGNVLKDGDLYEVTNYDGTLPTNDTTAVDVNDTRDDYNYAEDPVVTDKDASTSRVTSTGNNTTSKDNTTDNKTTSQKTSSSQTTSDQNGELLAEKYKKLFSSQTYYIEFTSDDMESPVTAAVKNGSIYMKTTLEGMNCTMIYKKDKDSVYIVLNDYRVYCKMPSSMLDELDVTDLTSSGGAVKDVVVYNATIGDRECRCEAYELENGNTSTYYFYQGTLVRMDQIGSDGTSSVMNITKVSSSVDDSLFELPKGFIPFNLSKLDLDKFAESESTTD